MTNFTYKSYIPKQDIKVRPEVLVKEIYKLFNKEIEDKTSEDKTSKIQLNYIKYFYKEIKRLLVNYDFWKNVCSYDFCCYQYSNISTEDDKGKICGRRINKKDSYDKQSNKFLCSEHDRNHRKYHSKPIQRKVDETYCKHINKDGTNCKHISKINRLCIKHHKLIYKINREEILNRILFYKNYTDINSEIILFNNIDIISTNKNVINVDDKKNNIQEVPKAPTIKLLEIVGGNLNNSDSSRNSQNKVNENKNVEIHTQKRVPTTNSNSNNINSTTNSNSNNTSISTSFSNVYSKIDELNNNIIENSKIFELLFKYNKDKYHRECDAIDCTNSKDYNIIYNKYCKHHINDRPKQLHTNFFYKHTNTTATTTNTITTNTF